jgi:hypothetical protein
MAITAKKTLSTIRDTAAVLAAANAIYPVGWIIIETSAGADRFKRADGVTPYNQLGYGGLMQTTKLASDVVVTGVANTLVTVTGLQFPVKAGMSYKFKFYVGYSAAIATTGSRWTIDGPAVTRLNYWSFYTLTNVAATFNYGLTAYNLPAASNASSGLGTANTAVVEGVAQPSADGIISLKGATEILNSPITALAGVSYVEWSEI